MSGNPRRRWQRREEDISGQFRVTVPDEEELDQLRTRAGIYRRGLYTLGGRDNQPPEKTQSLPASSRESSTEPMDTDDARRASEEIYRRIQRQTGLGRSGSAGDVTLLPEVAEIIIRGRTGHQRNIGEQIKTSTTSSEDQVTQAKDTVVGAVGGRTLLNIPPCSMAEELGEQNLSLFRPPMSDPELKLERRHGTKPKTTAPLTTQTIQEEARAAPTEQRALQLRGTDFYLPLGGQPRISERKSWRGPVVTEQGNPGIYVQIDEWLPLYKGNVYVVDEITGRMYLSKGEHLMRIAETASHRPFQDHELSISRHVPEREHTEPVNRPAEKLSGMGTEEKTLQSFTPIAGAIGEVGKMPMPVAESTRQPPERETEPLVMGQTKVQPAVRDDDPQRAKGVEWALPTPIEARRPLREGMPIREEPSQRPGQLEEDTSRQEYPTPRQQLIEADKRRRRKLATLARDHIVKLREERRELAQGWLEEYSMRAAAEKLKGHNLQTLRAEYVHRYNQLLEREKQPHCDFFLNLSFEVEEELDFEEEARFDLSEYNQHFEWDEAEYLKLRFIAARHYASRGHWDDAYAYVLRTRPDNVADHEDTYNRNAQAWHYTNARINEIIQEAEQALEFRDRRVAQWSPHRPPEGSLIPPGRSAEPIPLPTDTRQPIPKSQDLSVTISQREQRMGEPRGVLKTPLSPDRESQREERKSAIDAVKQITGTQKEVFIPGNVNVEGTPEYDWDTRYDGVQGFASHLKNRVSEPSTPQRDQSPRERAQTPHDHKELSNN